MPAESNKITIRRATIADAPRLAELSGQLGYPATAVEIRTRLRRIQRAAHHAVFVAHSPKQGAVGWIPVSRQPLHASEIRAEVNGLVVADGTRSLGVGARLLAAAEDWAR